MNEANACKVFSFYHNYYYTTIPILHFNNMLQYNYSKDIKHLVTEVFQESKKGRVSVIPSAMLTLFCQL